MRWIHRVNARTRKVLEEALELSVEDRALLAADLLAAFAATRTSLVHTPLVGTAQRVGKYAVRQALLDGFPYAIVFAETDEGFLVVAVAHLRRRPRYCRGRLRGSAPEKRSRPTDRRDLAGAVVVVRAAL